MNIDQFQETVRSLRPKLVTLACRMVKQRDEAEDIVQEVFIRLWMSRAKLETYDNLEAVAVTTLRNRCIDEYRKKRMEYEELKTDRWEQQEANAAERMELSDELQLLLRIIRNLPDLQGLIIRLKDVEGYDTEEIARITHSSVDSVRMNLSRARKKVREIFLKSMP